ncbi:MAG: AraC family transcriptional regulator [Deltaproteobacteria bacterium]|nr:AraC family transcriptional regulator [Deltaproteobacteria bacterium]
MDASIVQVHHLAPSAAAAPALAALTVEDFREDAPRVAIPRAEIQLIVRFGPSAQRGLDVHVLGARQRVHRKLIRGGQRAVSARLRLGAHDPVLGTSAATLAGRIVALEELWGAGAVRRFTERLASARDTLEAAKIVDAVIAERLSSAATRRPLPGFVSAAVQRLSHHEVNAVAAELGVSGRHLRRAFREAIGMSPKAFARLTRFLRALRAARTHPAANWASIAADHGYSDQAHLIAEFRDIAGVTPRALMGELGG